MARSPAPSSPAGSAVATGGRTTPGADSRRRSLPASTASCHARMHLASGRWRHCSSEARSRVPRAEVRCCCCCCSHAACRRTASGSVAPSAAAVPSATVAGGAGMLKVRRNFVTRAGVVARVSMLAVARGAAASSAVAEQGLVVAAVALGGSSPRGGSPATSRRRSSSLQRATRSACHCCSRCCSSCCIWSFSSLVCFHSSCRPLCSSSDVASWSITACFSCTIRVASRRFDARSPAKSSSRVCVRATSFAHAVSELPPPLPPPPPPPLLLPPLLLDWLPVLPAELEGRCGDPPRWLPWW